MDMVSTGTDFSNASLNGSEFDLTSLYDVDLSGADMTDASFSRLALIGCNLSGIKLIGIKNYESILQFLAEADLQGAEMSDDLLLNIQEIRSLRSHS